tara:strand:- start:1933 stop:4125 length:2193 start_codon:yes stop_codon:yes gene_type:complete
MSRARDLSKFGNINSIAVDNTDNEVGIASTAPTSTLDVRGEVKVGTAVQLGSAGVITATSFSGSGANLTGIAGVGVTATVVSVATTTGLLNVTGTTDSTSSTTGSVTIAGGVGIAKNVFIGAGLSVAGTLTYEDVTSVDSVGLITAKSGVNITGGELTVGSGITMGIAGVATFSGTGDVHLLDNVRLNVGDSNDFQVSHDGSDTILNNTTGSLKILSDQTISFRDSGDSEAFAVFTDNGSVSLYYDNSKKWETTNDGTVTTGIATATGGVAYGTGMGATISSPATNTLALGTNGAERLRITSGGNIGVGNTASFPIFTDSGDRTLIIGTGSDDAAIQLHCGTDKYGGLYYGDATSGGDRYSGYIEYKHDDNYLRFGTGGSERLRITGDGPHLLLGGTADVNEITETSSNTGIVIGGTGLGNGGIAIINSTTGTGRIYFGDATGSGAGRNRGQVNYYHNGDYMMFAAAGSERFRIHEGGSVTTGICTATDFSGASGGAADFPNGITATSVDTTSGIDINANSNLRVGSGQNFQFKYTGSEAQIIQMDNSNPIRIKVRDGAETAAMFYPSGSVDLYFDDSKKFETTNDGVVITGIATVSQGANFDGILTEKYNETAGKVSDNPNIDLENGMIHFFTTTESTTSAPNLRFNSSISLNNKMNVGDSLTVTIILSPAAGGYSNNLTIDSSGVTEEWLGGSAPSSGGSGGYDVYSYTVLKRGNASFTVLANLQNYA